MLPTLDTSCTAAPGGRASGTAVCRAGHSDTLGSSYVAPSCGPVPETACHPVSRAHGQAPSRRSQLWQARFMAAGVAFPLEGHGNSTRPWLMPASTQMQGTPAPSKTGLPKITEKEDKRAVTKSADEVSLDPSDRWGVQPRAGALRRKEHTVPAAKRGGAATGKGEARAEAQEQLAGVTSVLEGPTEILKDASPRRTYGPQRGCASRASCSFSSFPTTFPFLI